MTAEQCYNYLTAAGMTPAGACGAMANIRAESGLIANSLQKGSKPAKDGMTNTSYTAAVDNGSYQNFAGDKAGYGLCQWTYSTRKAALLASAKAAGKSVGDWKTQLDFFLKELRESFPAVLAVLTSAATVREASDAMLLDFEKPADQSEDNRKRRAGYGEEYYKKFVKEGQAMTEIQLRQNVVNIINGWIGATKGSAKHQEILSIYNGYKPLARCYTMKTADAYCAATVSAAFIKAGIAGHTGTECGVEKFVQLAKTKGIWVENDAHTPKLGDACVYDWQDDGKGDCTGAGDHIGIVSATSGNGFTVTEGNMTGGKVGTRAMAINGRYIRGFICPNYAEIAKTMDGAAVVAAPASSPAATSTAKVTERKATGAAKSFDKGLAGTYTVTAASGLHIRDAAGTNAASMAILPKGTAVQCYGYYTLVGGVKWLYIQVTYKNVTYTGFSSGEYLDK